MSESDQWSRLSAPPPPLFAGEKERSFVKNINDELIERVIGQTILYYPISLEHTNYHPLYGEAINKTFLPPIRVHVLVEWEGQTTETKDGMTDIKSKINVLFHKKRLTLDQNVNVKIGDFVLYGSHYYEIIQTTEVQQIFGQVDHKMEIKATCIRARDGVFNAK